MKEEKGDTIIVQESIEKPRPRMDDPQEWALIRRMYFTPKPPDDFGGKKRRRNDREEIKNQAR